ncbi:hypothetical protein SAMN06265222_101628 [Neorhodopirellula lusitana]|uniref:Uncharacterized protein n=1 Tax=Neorhodopirellula lusitana TaxID=445327 RepID=A0ABY1PS94_9BACT|nr:hypothetical protein [Neorhodopirellula lusitana]SMP41621.1 hypothetical protein SAMN06265222_101628 [Neorhodopirellula lusitana]
MSNCRPDNTRRRPGKPSDKLEVMSLFDYGATAQATRAEAHEAAKPKQADRTARAEEILLSRGATGCTRHELADLMGLPLQSICSPALRLLRDGLTVEPGIRRPTPSGGTAAVMVHVEHANECVA